MKVRGCWFTLLLVGSSIISVSPNSSTTAITTFQQSNAGKASTGISTKLDPLHNYIITTPTTKVTSIHHKMFIKQIDFPKRRKERDADQGSSVPPCHKFEVGDPEINTLYSPNYPDNYPKNIDCVRVLEAREGHIIRLDFRNSFSIEEKDDCKFDFLEIRDGPYGFSKLLGKYCGQTFPGIQFIDSSGRHLWLHFHSDESIEYSGFTAVYEFIKPKEEHVAQELNCIIKKEGSEGFVNRTDISPEVISNVTHHRVPIDCMWIIKVKENWKIQLKFLKFDLSKPNDCDINFVDIFNEKTDMPSRLKNFCGSAGDAVTSDINVLHIRFYAEPVAINSTFDVLYTAFREKGSDKCAEGEYDCEDATCISDELKCNGRDNCKFRWDEEGCEDKETGQSEHVIIIIVVFGLILGGMVVTFLVNCIRKILRDQKIIREHIRQSKESKLDEMGRASAKRSRENLSIKLSPREKHSQSSLQILDDVSKRYYREIVPISVQNSRTDVKGDSILRQQHDIVVQTGMGGGGGGGGGGDDTPSPERGGSATCDMGCQTRESLFQPVGWKASVISPSPHDSTAAAIRFSTFGYDAPPPSKGQSLSRQSTNRDKSRASTAIEMDETGLTELPHRGPEVCLHHHQHQQHLQQQQQQQKQLQQQPHQHHHHPTTGKGGKQKADESKVFIDIRNSAPDVIIMTSH